MKIENLVAKQINSVGIIEKKFASCKTGRAVIKLDGSRPTIEDVRNHSPLLRSTYGTYHIVYNAHVHRGYKDKRPFIIINDLLGFSIYVVNSKHFESLGDIYPEVAWMLKNTNYKSDLFTLAKMQPGMRMTFSLDFAEYGMKIWNEQIKGTEVEGKEWPFFVTTEYERLIDEMKPSKNDYKNKVLQSNARGDFYMEGR